MPTSAAVPAFDLVIFGGTGDLALRKLLPALLHRHAEGQLAPGTRVLGIARDVIGDDEWRTRVRGALERANGSVTPQFIDEFLRLLSYSALDIEGVAGWDELRCWLDAGVGGERVRVFYLATSPNLFAPTCEGLRTHGLIDAHSRVVIEKPIGRDLDSAREINAAIGRAFEERNTFRIDHYLGKETVQNLIALRFANALFEPLWRAQHIDHVQITVAETIGVERRGAYYDGAGALRDMVQNHLLQLLCLVAMEPPATFDADAIRDEKLKVLHALAPIDASNAAQHTVRGQYRDSAVPGSQARAYVDEVGRRDSRTETFVALRTQVRNWRWAEVPFYLRTGKCLPQRVSEIVVAFRSVPHSIFGGGAGALVPNQLVVRVQPDEGIKLWLMLKSPGPGGMRLRRVPLDMSFANAFGGRQPDAYERLLLDVVRGNPMLFMRRDEVEAAWRWIDPIRAAWDASDEAPRPYAAGSWGPSAAIALIERDGRTWHEEQA
ncbi:MAG: glucose-6-phosphate dehydrogenase [Dokdonella sp.]|nr:MAG: glucose-6-phosphate dehydrogenase [Dokdonella sp.]